jgi:hemolysin III
MKKRKRSKDGSVHVTDEIFNTASHIIGCVFALTTLVILVVYASVQGKVWHIVSFAIYGASLVMVFLASTFHHGIEADKKVEWIFRQFDYFAIFLLIAGTYTPFCLVLLRGPLGWSVFGITWGLAALGIVIKSVYPKIPKWVTNVIYVSMGWLAVIMIVPLLKIIGITGISLLTLGGAFYTIGSFIFYAEKPNPLPGKFGFHEIWHIFVIAGALTHALLIYFYILPAN